MWIPGEICSLIFSRLPVRSVLACKCVCKDWLELISRSEFIEMHLNFHRENSNCLMLGGGEKDKTNIHSIGYDSLASVLLPELEQDNDNNDNAVEIEEEEEEEDLWSGIDGYLAQMDYPFKHLAHTVELFGSCNGCVCLWFNCEYQNQFFCLWNPATREYKRMSEVPKIYAYPDIRRYAFVYNPTADDYNFLIVVSSEDGEEEETSEMWSLVHVYTLGSDSWNSFLTPHYFCSDQKSGVLFNGDLHLVDLEDSIVSLDIRNEKFIEIQPPFKSLKTTLILVVLEECLCLIVENASLWRSESWTQRYTITNEIITEGIQNLRFMWSFKNGVILFKDWSGLVLYDPEHGNAFKRSVLNGMSSAENYSQSLVSLNSGCYVGGRTTNSTCLELQILKNRYSVLEKQYAEKEAHNTQLVASNAKLKAHNAQLVASNGEFQRKLHEFQKEAEGGKQGEEEETAVTKKKNQKRKVDHRYNIRASKAARESTNFEDESLAVQQRAKKEQAKLVPLSMKEGSKTHSTSKD